MLKASVKVLLFRYSDQKIPIYDVHHSCYVSLPDNHASSDYVLLGQAQERLDLRDVSNKKTENYVIESLTTSCVIRSPKKEYIAQYLQ
jgi:hypothetical protein